MVITGASAGIGAATALACARAGMDVVLGARRRDRLDAVAQQIEAIGRRAVPVTCDVARDADVAALFEQALGAFGRVDALFANAGHGLCAPVLSMTDAQHREIFEVNYFGTVRTLQAGTPAMRQADGGLRHIVVCSSVASEIALPDHGAYAATKAAQDAVAGALRAELAAEGFVVTTVHPVGTRTEFSAVVGRRSGREIADATPNTPAFLAQSAETVARAVVRSLRRPRPEVWPMPAARYALAMTTACPRLAAWMMRRRARRRGSVGASVGRGAQRG